MKKQINIILIFLILLDLILFTVCLFKPDLWIHLMHGGNRDDSLGLLSRQGGVWAAFFLFQVIALLRWEKETYWLVLVAGIRLTEVFSDWIYFYFAPSLTLLGKAGLLAAPPINLWLGFFLIKSYLRLNKGARP